MRIVFAGTPEFAAIHLKTLIDNNTSIVGVYTQPDRPAGRGKKLRPSPVKQLAIDTELPVFQPLSLKSAAAQQELAALKPDIMIVVAYGLILPQAILDLPTYGCLNVHASLLPRWRGAAPIQRAIEAGDITTGVTIMQMDAGLDTGDMLLKTSLEIAADETSLSLHDKLAEIGPPALMQALELIAEKALRPHKQNDENANYARKIDKEEAKINWAESADIIERKIRAFNPFPICYFDLNNHLRIKVHRASVSKAFVNNNAPGKILSVDKTGIAVRCGSDALIIETLQLPGKNVVSVQDFLNGSADLFKLGQFLEVNSE